MQLHYSKYIADKQWGITEENLVEFIISYSFTMMIIISTKWKWFYISYVD